MAKSTDNRKQTQDRPATASLQFSMRNWILVASALASIILGYVLLGQGSITAAPFLLILGYVVLIPLAILL